MLVQLAGSSFEPQNIRPIPLQWASAASQFSWICSVRNRRLVSGDLEMTRVKQLVPRASRAELDLKQWFYSQWNWLLKLNVLMVSNSSIQLKPL